MPQYTYLTDLAYVYLGLLGAFSIAQLLLLQSSNRVHILLWVSASFFSALGTAFMPHLLTIVSVSNFGIWGGLSTLLGGILRFLALSYRRRSFIRSRIAWGLFALSILAMPLAATSKAEYRLLVSSLAGASISAACFIAMIHSRMWKARANLALQLSLTGMAISATVLLVRAFTSYPFGIDQIFVGESELQRHAFEILVLISFFLQLGFTGMIVANRDKEGLFADRRALRIAQHTMRMRKRNYEIAKTAKERLDLIQLLTHEVRQPITNAQASLQSVSLHLHSVEPPPLAALALNRAQASLDQITLALSNIIVAATIMSAERRWQPEDVDASAILEMALLDSRVEERQRINILCPEGSIYVHAPPMLLRVALHNILDQAIRLSDDKHSIDVEISLNPNASLVTIKTFIYPREVGLVDQNLFYRRRSSDTNRSAVSPLGFFVVRQVASEMSGDITFTKSPDGRLAFILTIPY